VFRLDEKAQKRAAMMLAPGGSEDTFARFVTLASAYSELQQSPAYLRNHPGIVRAMVASPHDKACITRFFGEMAALMLAED